MKNEILLKNNDDSILIVEDSPTQAERLRYILEENNFNVLVAKNGKEALDLIKANLPTIVISDIVMPVMDGYKLCEAIKSNPETIKIPVILLTSLSNTEDVLKGIDCGADNFLTKPYNEAYLISHVKRILANLQFGDIDRVRMGIEIVFGGKKRFITTNQQQMFTLLISTYEAAVQRNNELMQSQGDLMKFNDQLEETVRERTAELSAEIEMRKQTEAHVIKLNRIYALLSSINQTLVRTKDTDQLLKDVCNIAVEVGKFQSAWIGLSNGTLDEIKISASAGIMNELTLTNLHENPITGVISSGQHFIDNNITVNNKLPYRWKQKTLSLGLQSFATFPIKVFGKVSGSFCIYSHEKDFFDEIEIRLLEEMTNDISFALEFIHKEAERKKYEQDLQSKNEAIAQQNEEFEVMNEELLQTNQELVAAKVKSEESDRLKSAFLANMSHEIRTPMNGILGFSQLLKEADLSGEQQKEYIAIIQRAGERMLNIINDIVSISKIEAEQMEIRVSEVDICDQIKYIYDFFIPEAKQKGLTLLYDRTIRQDEQFIETDQEKVLAILINLVKNAIKFTNKGTITLGCEKKGSFLEFSVSDTGKGIPQGQQSIIFDRFRQGSESLTRNYEGAGLGLSISKAYVEMLGGKIWLESEQGKGSTFYFNIPHHTSIEEDIRTSKGDTSEEIPVPAEKLKILIVENDQTSVEFLTIILKDLSKELVLAGNGTEAIDKCHMHPDIDLILMDIKMPQMDGYEATRQIRQFNKEVVIIAQTAFGLTGDKQKAIDAGCNDYISKPVKKDLLMELIGHYFL